MKNLFKLKSVLKTFTLLFLFSVSFLAFDFPATAQIQTTKTTKDLSEDSIDDYLREQMARNQIPAVSVAIVNRGKIVKLKSYGVANLEWNQPTTTDTALQIASSTKPFTGTALMMLVEEGKLALEDKISKYLTDTPAAWQNITIRHLATHSSGITNRVSAKPETSVEEFGKAAYPLPLDYQPGEKAMYA